MIGFAGPRVIEQNTGIKLPEGFQTAEFQKECGFVDIVIERRQIKECIYHLLKLNKKRKKKYLEQKECAIINTLQREMSTWDKIQLVRSCERATSLDYINRMFDYFVELCGDKIKEEDHAIIAGIAEFKGIPVTVIGNQKGKRNVEEALYYNWEMASPSGFRKALRIMKQAEKFQRPIICFIDTIGADCGKKAEEGQGIAIANLLQEMSTLKIPILSIVISEGGSGGALALGIGNEVWMLENAIYSILNQIVTL